MKYLKIIIVLALLCSNTMFSQTNQMVKKEFLLTFDVSGLTPFSKAETDIIEASKIKVLNPRRKGSVSKGILIGLLTGVTNGGISGLVEDYDNQVSFSLSKEEKAVSLRVSLGLVGSGIGAFTGSTNKKFKINGNLNDYLHYLEVLLHFSIQLD